MKTDKFNKLISSKKKNFQEIVVELYKFAMMLEKKNIPNYNFKSFILQKDLKELTKTF